MLASRMLQLDQDSLARLRSLIAAVRAEPSALVDADLLELSAALNLPGRLVIDMSVAEQLGHPLVLFEPGGNRASSMLAGLSQRESDVAALVAGGLANKQIATRLGISTGTVKHHVHRILAKTGLPSRAAIASAFVERIS
jgi:DNA-binding NarL/FixJ family response regulator